MKYAFRSLAKSPGYTAVALLTLSLGIGLNTSMFSILRVVVMRTLSYPESDRLMRVYRTGPNFDSGSHSPANFLDLRTEKDIFEGLAAFHFDGFSLAGDDRPPEWLRGMRMTADFFPLLRSAPALGRVFTAEAEEPGAGNVVVLTHSFWVNRFARDAGIVGRQIRLSGEPVTVIGVMAPEFEDPLLWGPIEVLRPLTLSPATRANRSSHSLDLVARLAPGRSVEQVDARLKTIASQVAAAYPDTNGRTSLRLLPLSHGSQIDEDGQITYLISGLSGFVLLIACANLANLQFARTASRAREHAVRAALGASRARLIGQVLTESLLLAIAGGVLGIAVALWCNDAIGRHIVFNAKQGVDLPLDLHGLAFAFLLSTFTGLAFGLLPAWFASRTDLNAALQQGSRGSTGAPLQHRLRQALIVAEVALALVLLSSAAVFVGGVERLVQRDPGWRTNGLLTGYLTFPSPASATTPELRNVHRRNFVNELESNLAALPGVDGVAFARSLPTFGYSGNAPFAIEGQPAAEPGQEASATVAAVSPTFFDLLGIRLLQGRVFTPADREDSSPVVIINETMARTFWPGRSPIGQRIGSNNPADPQWREIVGVVADSRSLNAFSRPRGVFQTFHPWAQSPQPGGVMILRGKAKPESLAPELRRVVARIAPNSPVRGLETISATIDRDFSNLRLAGWMLTCFALLGLLLSAVGIYGLLAHHVVQRTNEIGIRMALGAQVRDVVSLILGQGLRLALIGAALGLAGALATGRLLIAIMPGLPAANLLTALLATAPLVGVALLACWLPARRATRVDPLVALRAE